MVKDACPKEVGLERTCQRVWIMSSSLGVNLLQRKWDLCLFWSCIYKYRARLFCSIKETVFYRVRWYCIVMVFLQETIFLDCLHIWLSHTEQR